MTDEKGELPPQTVQHNVTSYNQEGGITAHTVNVSTVQRRRLDEATKTRLLKVTRGKPFIVCWPISDGEASKYALEIRAFLESAGYISKGSAVVPPVLPPGISFNLSADPIEIRVGPMPE
jgi:hypothetical protein